MKKYYTAEIFPTKKSTTPAEWQTFFCELAKLSGPLGKWQIIVTIINHHIRFYLQAPHPLPATLSNIDSFLLKSTPLPSTPPAHSKFRPLVHHDNLIGLIDYASARHYGNLQYISIAFRALSYENFYTKTQFYFLRDDRFHLHQSFAQLPSKLLSLDFTASKSYTYKSPPKYTDTNKILEFLHHDPRLAILSIDAFPYLANQHFLKLSDYDFAKHSLVLGSSGSGKSKFLSSFITNLYQDSNLRANYKVVVIDPHATLAKDIGVIGQVIDFLDIDSSIDLFSNTGNNANASTELLLDLFKTLLASQYNSKLERVLRHSIYLLLVSQALNFPNLRKLLTDLEYRNLLIKNSTPKLPFSIINFFLSDFNELRTKSYSEAISPIIAFLDEIEMIPIFNQTKFTNNLENTIEQNYLTLFSLSRTKLGTKVTRTISGLIMEQLLTLVESSNRPEHIIFIVDEVAVIENPILARLLSEARKYNLSLFLVSQFFNQFSNELQNSVFANVANYYLFRLSRLEATLLADNLGIKIPADNSKERRIALLSELNNRECIARISMHDKLFPAFKASTLNFVPLTGDTNG